jgi:phage head maturation protease
MTIKILRFQATARPNSFDPEKRTFTVIAATQTPVDRGSYLEIIDIASFAAGGLPEVLPLQVDHSTSVRDTIGQLTNFRTETVDGVAALVADAALSSRADNEALAANLKDGVQSAFSIAFTVSKWRGGKDPKTQKKTRTALAGKLVEGSLVVSPADPKSKVRKLMEEDEVIEKSEATDVQLRSLAKAAGVAETVIDAVLATEATTDQKMQTMLATLNAKPIVRTSTPPNDESLDNPTVLRRSAVEAFDAIAQGKPAEGQAAAVFADGEVAFAKRLLRAAGENVTGLSDSVILRNAATTSDYAIIAGGTFNLSMRREYEASGSPLAALFGTAKVSSFNKENSGLVDWTTMAVADKKESGEYKYSYIDESGEKIFVATIGGVTAISRELSINAAGRLGNIGTKYGKRLAADVADRQVAFLEQASAAGPSMADGHPVFYAARGNIEAFSQVPDTLIASMMGYRSDMAKRKGAGNVMIGVYPTHWLIHSDYEETAARFLASYTATTIADVNPLAGKLQIVVEPRLADPDTSWLVAEPSKMDGAVKVLLSGHEAPFTDSRQNFDTDAIDFKIRQDFGLGWLEWRSWTRLDHS